MSDQPSTPATDSWAAPAPAPADAPAPAPAEQPAPAAAPTPAAAEQAPAPADKPAEPAKVEDKPASLHVGQIVGYTDEDFGYDVARHGIVVEVDGDNARVVPLPGAFHVPVDELTAQD